MKEYKVKEYRIYVSDGHSGYDLFYSTSKNAKQHLINYYGTQSGAFCMVYNSKGKKCLALYINDANGKGYYAFPKKANKYKE